TIEQIDNKINNLVSVTQYTTDMNDIVTDINTQGTRIGQNEKAIGLKADSSELDAVENSLTNKIGNVEVTADGAKMTASEVRADLDGLDIGIRNLIINGGFKYGRENWSSVDGENLSFTSTGFLKVSRDQYQEGNVNLVQKRDMEHPWTMENRSEEHTSELQSRFDLVCRLLL